MKKQTPLVDQGNILNEIIDNASELPLESQNLILMLVKGMAYTRDCIIKNSLSNKYIP